MTDRKTDIPSEDRGARRGFSVAAIVVILVAMHLLVIRAVTATGNDAIASAWAMQGERAEAALDSAHHIAAGELLAGRTPPDGPITLPDGSEIEIVVTNGARPWTVTISARSGESFRLRDLTID